jgi:hypothetical protein
MSYINYLIPKGDQELFQKKNYILTAYIIVNETIPVSIGEALLLHMMVSRLGNKLIK